MGSAGRSPTLRRLREFRKGPPREGDLFTADPGDPEDGCVPSGNSSGSEGCADAAQATTCRGSLARAASTRACDSAIAPSCLRRESIASIPSSKAGSLRRPPPVDSSICSAPR